MKKYIAIAIAAIALCATSRAENTGNFAMGFYPMTNATDCAWNNVIGACALENGMGVSFSDIFGHRAGTGMQNCMDCVAIGTKAGLGAVDCTNCVFLGSNSGKNANGWRCGFDICGVIKSEGSNVTIQKPLYARFLTSDSVDFCEGGIYANSRYFVTIAGATIDNRDGYLYISGDNIQSINFTRDVEFHQNVVMFTDGSADWTTFLKGWTFSGENPRLQTLKEAIDESVESKVSNCSLKLENGTMNVYHNGTKVGTLSYTPAP